MRLASALALCVVACSSKKPATVAAPKPEIKETLVGAGTLRIPSDQPGLAEHMQVHLNLQNLVHLADIEHNGLFLDFGTPARMKYTDGNWKTGWGNDGVDGDTTYTHAVSTNACLFFPLSTVGAFTLRMRLRPIGATTVQPVLNDEPLAVVKLDKGPGFSDYEVAVPVGEGHVGENQLLLRFDATTHLGDEDVAAAVDSIRFIPQPKPSIPGGTITPNTNNYEALPIYGALLQELPVGGMKRTAITVSAQTSLAYYLEVPKTGKLTLRIGTPDKPGLAYARVLVTPAGGKPVQLWKGAVPSQWQAVEVPLMQFAGRVVKLELVAFGEGVVGFASPAIMVVETPVRYPPTTPKSVILLLVDTLRADHLRPFNPHTRVRTPIVDEFATQAAVFEAAQAPENWTKPSCASVLTGLSPESHGTKTGDAKLSDKALMVSEVFKQAGFTTATFIANGFVSERFGFNQGWDDYTNYIHEHHIALAPSVFRDAANWVEAHKDKRFFLYIQTIDPHVPYDPPDDMLKLYQPDAYTGPIKPRSTAEQLEKAKGVPPKLVLTDADKHYIEALYDGEISGHDRALGTFIERLKKLGVYDQTMVVITADHGEEFEDHGSWGHGHSVYQELLHVPLMVRFPPTVPARRIDQTVSTVDIAPTLLAAAGLPVPDVMEGVDRSQQLMGGAAPAPAVAFSEFLDNRRVIRAGRWKLIVRGITPTLFDLETDPKEQIELDIHKHPIAMRYCRVLLGQFLGARDRGDWLSADPRGRSVEFKEEDTDIDEATRAGLKALGYAN
jgi:arylsulfatase A-like enzyme